MNEDGWDILYETKGKSGVILIQGADLHLLVTNLKGWGNLTLLSGPQHETLPGLILTCIFSWSCGRSAFARPLLPCPHTWYYSFICTCAREPALSRQECSRPLWDTEAIQKRAVLNKLSTGKMLKQFLIAQHENPELLKKEVNVPCS